MSSTTPFSKLHKINNCLSFHKVREEIASEMVWFHHIPGCINTSDILTKNWSRSRVWPTLQPLFFWEGNTAYIVNDG